MRKTFLMVYVVVFLFAGVATALAAAMTISEANNAPHDTEATITGLVGALGNNEFTLTDDTGTIKFECGPSWYKQVDLVAGEKVTVTGEIDKGKTGASAAELDAFSVTKSDGSKVEIGAGGGKPPWAGTKSKGGGKSGVAEDNCGDDCGDTSAAKPAKASANSDCVDDCGESD